MKSSHLYSIPSVIEFANEVAPKNIIDIGAGSGKYGMLCREYVPTLKFMDAIEPEEMMNGSFWYDQVFETTIQKFKFDYEYDLGLLVAVLEYLEPSEGEEMLKKIKNHCRYFIVTWPDECQHHTYQWDIDSITTILGPYKKLEELEHDSIMLI